jgi:hypothetical protein
MDDEIRLFKRSNEENVFNYMKSTIFKKFFVKKFYIFFCIFNYMMIKFEFEGFFYFIPGLNYS